MHAEPKKIHTGAFAALVSVLLLIIPALISLPLAESGDRKRAGLEIVISELAPHGSGFQGEDWVELLVVTGSGDISGYVLSSFDKQDDDESFANTSVTVNAGERLVIHYNGSGADETDITGDSNSNGYFDLYIGSSELSRTHEQAALYTSPDYSVMVDGVCWSKGDITASEASDAQNLVDLGMWPSNSASDMVYSDDIDKGISIARKEGKDDSDNANDWYVEPKSSPGLENRLFNFTGEVLITGAYLSGSPKAFTMKVMTGGGDVSCLSISDLDRASLFLANEPVTLAQGDELKLYFGTGTNETDATGDINQNGIKELYIDPKSSPTGTTDAVALFNGLEVLDAVAWCTDGKLSSGEISDLEFLIFRSNWDGNTSEHCVNISVMGTRNELVRSHLNDTNSKADWEISGEINTEIDLKEFDLKTFSNVDSVTCGVSPDSSFWLLAGLIENATKSIHIEVYQFDNFKIAEKVLAAQERNVEVKILLEGAPVRGIPDMEKYIMKQITDKGGEVRYIITDSNVGIKERYTNVHSKFAVVDGEKAFITSENFRDDAIPYYGTLGNRGWSIVIDSDEVAEYFEEVFSYDFTPGSPDSFPFTEKDPVYGGPPNDFNPSSNPKGGKYEKIFKNQQFSDSISVTPVLCPDHTSDLEAILPMLENANEYIYVQQHSVNDNWKKNSKYVDNKYLEALYDAARRGVEVRIQFDETFKFSNEHWEIINATNNLADEEKLNMMAKFTYNKEIQVAKVHNKGIIVDGEKVLISSINWATNSIYNNREVGVIIESGEVAGYYREIFVFDWGGEEIVAMSSIAGVVKDEGGKPLQGAKVNIDSLGISTITDEEGQFVLNKTPVGSYMMNISLKGYDDIRIIVKAKVGETTIETFTLEKEGSVGEDEESLSTTLVLILGVILILVVIILAAVILNAKKVRGQEKGKTVTRLSGDQHPFDDKVEKEP